MKRLMGLGALVAAALVLLAAGQLAYDGPPPRFNRTTALDTAQINDTRGVHGERVCATPDSDDCTVIYLPNRRF